MSLRSRAFTLLELIVVLVVLAVLAAIAVPTFARVIERSSDEATLTSLSAVAREAQALRALDSAEWSPSQVEEAIGDTAAAAAPGLSASGMYTPLPGIDADPTLTEIAYSIQPEGILLAARSDDDRLCSVAATESAIVHAACEDESSEPHLAALLASNSSPFAPVTGGGLLPPPDVTPLAAPAAGTVEVTASTLSYAFAPLPSATGYRLTCLSPTEAKKVSGSSSPLVLEDLPAGARYTCTLAASRAGSFSEESEPVSAVTTALATTGVSGTNIQFGSAGSDFAGDVAVASDGTSFIVGRTSDKLGTTQYGGGDAFIRSYSSDGALLWTEQFGSSGSDTAFSVALSPDENSLYVGGDTAGDLFGQRASTWAKDVFVAAYAVSGDRLWAKQFGSVQGEEIRSMGVASNGNVTAFGYTESSLAGTHAGGRDGFVRTYSPSGELLWQSQFGTAATEYVYGGTVGPDGSVYTVGSTEGSLAGANAGGPDAFVRKYDMSGSHVWTRQYGTAASDNFIAATVGPTGTLYLGGSTAGTFVGSSAGGHDALVSALAPSGDLLWHRQFGTSGTDQVRAVLVASDGTLSVVGVAGRSLTGPHLGGSDVFARVYAPDGTIRWEKQWGSSSEDSPWGAAVDPAGRIHVVGDTYGVMYGTQHYGSWDAFYSQYS